MLWLSACGLVVEHNLISVICNFLLVGLLLFLMLEEEEVVVVSEEGAVVDMIVFSEEEGVELLLHNERGECTYIFSNSFPGI